MSPFDARWTMCLSEDRVGRQASFGALTLDCGLNPERGIEKGLPCCGFGEVYKLFSEPNHLGKIVACFLVRQPAAKALI